MIPLKASLRSYDSAVVSIATGIETGSVSLVQQHYKEEVDVNTIVRRFGLTAAMPSGAAGGMYGDFTGITDYDDAVARIERANAGFMSLPAEVRERFGNDPSRLISLAQTGSEAEFLAATSPTPVAAAGEAPAAVVKGSDGGAQ